MDTPLMLSYAQNLEDYHLSLAFAGQDAGTYIDIGAGHPIADNVSFWFYERGWQGIVVEPQHELAALYARLRPRDVAVCALIGRTCGERDFYLVDRLHGLSTTVERHAQAAMNFGVTYRTVRMAVTTLAQLSEQHNLRQVDFLKIDVEGAEAEVLLGGDWRRLRPRIIVVEAVTPGSNEPAWEEWEPLLLQHGYCLALFDGLNRFYVAQECPEVLGRMSGTPAPWTSVRHMYEIGRAPENPLHPDHGLAQDLARGLWASLPYLEHELILSILRRARRCSSPGELESLAASVETERFRAALGRIACGYDGGQIIAPD
jgi:FkbM family methyltransferase